MINRDNWIMTKKHIDYLIEIEQHGKNSTDSIKAHLRHLLEWADSTPFSKAPSIRPTFPKYLGERLEMSTAKVVCSSARKFFKLARMSSKRFSQQVSELWITTLVPARGPSNHPEYHEYTLDEIIQIAELPCKSLILKRDQAAAAFLFISAMRISAFVSLPISNVDMQDMSVKQFPSDGVMTKLKKSAVTYMLRIPRLLAVVMRWDDLVRSELDLSMPWYATVVPSGLEFDKQAKFRDGRRDIFVHGLKVLCKLAGIEYRSPHKIRHGFAVYCLKNSRDMADVEAISKTLMHNSLNTTVTTYATLGTNDVRDRIARIGQEE